MQATYEIFPTLVGFRVRLNGEAVNDNKAFATRAEAEVFVHQAQFLNGFHSVVAPVHDGMAYQTHKWTLGDTKALWQEQVDYMEGNGPGMGRDPGWGAREEAGGYDNGVVHGKEFLEAYDEPYNDMSL